LKEGKPHSRPRSRWEKNTKTALKNMGLKVCQLDAGG